MVNLAVYQNKSQSVLQKGLDSHIFIRFLENTFDINTHNIHTYSTLVSFLLSKYKSSDKIISIK